MFRSIKLLGLVVIVAVTCLLAQVTQAGTSYNWNVGSGNWNIAANWNPAAIPGAGDFANIAPSDGVSRTINYDYTGAGITLSGLAIDLFGGSPLSFTTFSMAANNLTVAAEDVGPGGRGSFIQNGGTHMVTNYLDLGEFSSGVGSYTLTNGALQSKFENLGVDGTGKFTQNSGTNTVSDSLYLGYGFGNGNYTMATGAILLAPTEYVGYGGTGTFNHNGGTNIVSTALYLAKNSGGTGNYTMATGAALSSPSEYVGYGGSGTFTQTGGTNTINNGGDYTKEFYLAHELNSTGNYTLGGGSLSVSATEYVGYGGSGTFTQNGGTHTLSGSYGSLYLAENLNSSGAYYLNGGTLKVDGDEVIGNVGTGNFNQTGGINILNSLTSRLYIGEGNGVSTYTLSGNGALGGADYEIVGEHSIGVFNQMGGTNSSRYLYLGDLFGSTGHYTLSGGSATFSSLVDVSTVTSDLTVSSGILTAGTLLASGVPGQVKLNGGTINAGALNFNGTPAALNWTSGTLNINSSVTWDPAAAGTSTSAAFGPSLTLGIGQTLTVTGNEIVGGAGAFSLTLNSGSTHNVSGIMTLLPNSTFTQNSGSTLYTPNFTQAGGTVNGALQNQGNFIYQSGVFGGFLINQGTVTLNADFTAGAGIENDTTMTIGLGRTVTANGGGGLYNLGTLTLSGGTLNGTDLINDYGAVMNAFGTIGSNANFINHGTLNVTGVLNAPSVNNDGVINIGSAQHYQGYVINSGTITLSGGSFNGASNGGLIQGGGSITGQVFNNVGVIFANSPTVPLTLTNTLTNSAGELRIADACTLSIVQDFANGGTIVLYGRNAVLAAGGAISNTGTISGLGRIGSSVQNTTGTIRAEGGQLTLAGFNNSNSAQIQAATGATVFVTQGLGSNGGTIYLTGGAFDNNSHTLSNSGIINGYGTVRTGGLTNTGKLNVGEGNMDVLGNVTNNGTIGIQGGRFAYFYGSVNGSGSFTGPGSATFLAALSPGNSPATVSFSGNVELTSAATLNIELGGTNPALQQYDQLHVAGSLALGGALNVVLSNGFKPVAGNSFDIMDWSSLGGTFDAVQLPTMNGRIVWDSSQLYTTGALAVVATYYAGDINRDGIVTVADISALMTALADVSKYRSDKNLTDPTLFKDVADVNGDGSVNNLDIQSLISIVASNAVTGASPGSVVGSQTIAVGAPPVTAVPEPATIVLFGLGAFAIGFRRRSK